MTDSAKHAEPWYIGSENIVYRRDADGMHCVAACDNADTARLVIAARDLLEACEATLLIIENEPWRSINTQPIRAAIAKAKGKDREQPAYPDDCNPSEVE